MKRPAHNCRADYHSHQQTTSLALKGEALPVKPSILPNPDCSIFKSMYSILFSTVHFDSEPPKRCPASTRCTLSTTSFTLRIVFYRPIPFLPSEILPIAVFMRPTAGNRAQKSSADVIRAHHPLTFSRYAPTSSDKTTWGFRRFHESASQ